MITTSAAGAEPAVFDVLSLHCIVWCCKKKRCSFCCEEAVYPLTFAVIQPVRDVRETRPLAARD